MNTTGATLRDSKRGFRQSIGFDTVLNSVARNTMLLVDETELPNVVADFHGYWASGSSGAPMLFNFTVTRPQEQMYIKYPSILPQGDIIKKFKI